MEHQINEEIRDKEVRLIGDDGEQLGILPIQQAQDIAVERAWIWSKSRRRLSRLSARSWITVNSASSRQSARREARKNQRVVEIKEIRLTPNIDIGDLNTKVKNACRFLQDGNKVKVSVRFRGREVTHASLGQGSAPSLRGAVLGVQHGRKAAQARRPPDADVSGARKGQVKPTRRYSANSERSKNLMPKIKNAQRCKKIFPLPRTVSSSAVTLASATCSTAMARHSLLKRHLRKEGFADSTNVAQLKRLLPYK